MNTLRKSASTVQALETFAIALRHIAEPPRPPAADIAREYRRLRRDGQTVAASARWSDSVGLYVLTDYPEIYWAARLAGMRIWIEVGSETPSKTTIKAAFGIKRRPARACLPSR